ncbi:unnamed protein product [Vitrella brassicaformis CCMP3155]|uniref:Uncharacterized protein n=1 Tax=Vitrella brassicaformis (strain CCMP3155) TaxID=1169540 RepID=A0A0G4GPR2_VITBC|nr:unnamed protein product [Vitrella brassicaformis CCMP3155]|eukprot:CEM32356.1 unnamed protein product [Vitrella brassicaformis CCMP3155]
MGMTRGCTVYAGESADGVLAMAVCGATRVYWCHASRQAIERGPGLFLLSHSYVSLQKKLTKLIVDNQVLHLVNLKDDHPNNQLGQHGMSEPPTTTVLLALPGSTKPKSAPKHGVKRKLAPPQRGSIRAHQHSEGSEVMAYGGGGEEDDEEEPVMGTKRPRNNHTTMAPTVTGAKGGKRGGGVGGGGGGGNRGGRNRGGGGNRGGKGRVAAAAAAAAASASASAAAAAAAADRDEQMMDEEDEEMID